MTHFFCRFLPRRDVEQTPANASGWVPLRPLHNVSTVQCTYREACEVDVGGASKVVVGWVLQQGPVIVAVVCLEDVGADEPA